MNEAGPRSARKRRAYAYTAHPDIGQLGKRETFAGCENDVDWFWANGNDDGFDIGACGRGDG